MSRAILLLGSLVYGSPFRDLGTITNSFKSLDDIDLIVFTGGADIDPALYGEKPHKKTSYPVHHRDKEEVSIFARAVKKQIPMVGICRGAQLLNVLNGGKLYQHVSGHAEGHQIVKSDGGALFVNSTHHQMMIPPNKNSYELLAWAEGVAKCYEQGPDAEKPRVKLTKDNKVIEPEVIWFPDTKCLCVQYHPENMSHTSMGAAYFQSLLEDYVL